MPEPICPVKAPAVFFTAGRPFAVISPATLPPACFPSFGQIRAGTSSIRKIPANPTTSTIPPIIKKITVQLEASSRLKPINPPNTTKIDTNGIIALMPSIFPLLDSSPTSVSQALYAASLAAEPKKVMAQSKIITRLTPSAAASATLPHKGVNSSILIKPKAKMETPHTK